ncbi:MAG TPA: MMPL family transporter [Atribacterota bacterium]|nr:MMPL family transporter [Atribacterota bacterium]
MMKKVADLITKYAWPIVIITIVITILAGSQLNKLTIEDDITKYMPADDPDIEFYSEIVDKFGGSQSETAVISLEYDDLFRVENLKSVKNIIDELNDTSYIKSVTSFLNMPEIISTEFGLEVKDLVEIFPENDKKARELKETLLKNNMVKGKFISADGNVTLLVIEVRKGYSGSELKNNLIKIIEPLKGEATKIYYSGMPLMSAEISESSRGTMGLSIVALIVMLFVLFFCFRSIRGVILPLFVAFMSSVWVLGLIASTGRNVTMVAAILPVIMISLGTAYGIHFVSRYYEERYRFEPLKAVKMTFRHTFVPILMSALTTMAGFLSLSAAIVRPITEFGIFSTLGIFFAFILATFFLGAFYKLFPPPKIHKKFSAHSNDLVSKLLKLVFCLVSEKKKMVIVIVLAVVLGGIGFATQIMPDSSMESRLGKKSQVVKTLNYFKEKFGGVDTLYIYTEANNVKNPYVLRQIKKIEDYSKRLPSLAEPSSISDFLIDLNNAMENKKIIPASEQKIDNLWFFAQDNEYLTSMVGDKDKDTLVSVKAKEMMSGAIDLSIAKIRTFIDTIPKKVSQIDLSQLDIEERKNYYPYIADEIISSLQAKGIEIKNIDGFKKELVQLAAQPNNEFERKDQTFISEILSLSSLEIEDLELTKEEISPLLTSYIQNEQTVDFFIDELISQINLSEDNALYLLEILEDSRNMAREREKIKASQLMAENFLGDQLTDEDKDILWYLTDNVVYVPDSKGNIEISFRLSGTPVITDRVNSSLFRGQIRSIILAFLMVFAMLVIQFKSLKIGFYSIIPLVLTVITAGGVMGIFHIPLNVSTMMVASIAIGAGIDYTIHFISRYKNELKSKEKTEALKTTLTGTGRAIIFNSISIAAGTFVLTLSSIGMMVSFGQLIGSVMLVSVIYTLLLLPILLDKVDFKIKKESK